MKKTFITVSIIASIGVLLLAAVFTLNQRYSVSQSLTAESMQTKEAQAQTNILIKKALLLGVDHQSTSDITDLVIGQDGQWASVPAGSTIRVTFAEPLDKDKDITLFAKALSVNQPARIEVYARDSDQLLAAFDDISEAKNYKILLPKLKTMTDSFDLKVLGGDLELDWLVDPAFTILRSFAANGNGSQPKGSLIISGSTVYGMTRLDGDNGSGTIFSMNIDGSGFTKLHSFDSEQEGAVAEGDLLLSGSKLYGMTNAGGSNDGAVFSLNTNGTGFTVLRNLVSGVNSGARPHGSLIISGSTLYGMTRTGGDDNLGTVFSISTSGTGFTLLHEFNGTDGSSPYGSLLLSGSTLYGMTSAGGSSSYGTIFSVNTDASGFTTLHNFTGSASDGRDPRGSLVISNSKLYGMTRLGGSGNYGIIFSINTDGTDFGLLHEFNSTNGANPQGSLTLQGTKLFGMTLEGGASADGVIFSINTDGTNFTLLREFAGGTSDGLDPYGSLLFSDSTLYGMTNLGGANNKGIIFSLTVDLTNPTITAFSPIDNATSVSADTNLVLTFDENVTVGSGNILIKNAADNSTVQTIAVGSGQVSGSGTNTITINPSADLANETNYYIQIPSTAFVDGYGNKYAGITDTGTWTFGTPFCSDVSNALSYHAYPTCGPATCSAGYRPTGDSCVRINSGFNVMNPEEVKLYNTASGFASPPIN